MAVYQDVLVVPVPQSELPDNKAEREAIKRAEAKEDQRMLVSLEDRLCDPSADTQSPNPKFESTPHRILVRAHEILSRVEATRNLALNTEDSTNSPPKFLPISILSIRECQALVRASVSFHRLSRCSGVDGNSVESEGRESGGTCIGNNEGTTSSMV